MKTIRQAFYYKDGGMFITQQEAIDDHVIKAPGKQNKRRGTIYKHKRKIAHESRRRNRARK